MEQKILTTDEKIKKLEKKIKSIKVKIFNLQSLHYSLTVNLSKLKKGEIK